MALLEIITEENVAKSLVLEKGEQQAPLFYLTLHKATQELECTQHPPERFLAAMVPIRGHWILMCRHGDADIRINQIPVIELKVLDDQDRIEIHAVVIESKTSDAHKKSIEFDSFFLRFIEESTVIIADDSLLIKERKACPICGEDFQIREAVIFCPKCGLAHHHKCWEELGKCASYPFCGYLRPSTETKDEERGENHAD